MAFSIVKETSDDIAGELRINFIAPAQRIHIEVEAIIGEGGSIHVFLNNEPLFITYIEGAEAMWNQLVGEHELEVVPGTHCLITAQLVGSYLGTPHMRVVRTA